MTNLVRRSDFDRDTLGGLLMSSVALHGSSPAFTSPERTWTYEELGEMTWTLARGLAAAGVGKGCRVAILMPSTVHWVAAAHAIALNGGVAIPISTLASPAERDHILRFADVSVVLSSERSGPRDLVGELVETYPFLASAHPGQLLDDSMPYLRRVFVQGLIDARGALEPWESLIGLADSVPSSVVAGRAAAVSPDDDAIVFFTSGSTAAPKAVLHAHRAPVTTMRAMASFQRLGAGEVLFGAKQFFWVGMTSTVGACIASGACFVGVERFEPHDALRLIEEHRVTVVNCSPNQLDQIGRAAEVGSYDLSALRLVEPSRLSRAAGLREGHDYLIGYGMTETAGTVCSLPADAPLELRKATNGRPIDGLELRTVDIESGVPLPPGVVGVVQVKGPTVMKSYLKQPQDAARADGFLVTQDLGFLDEDGYFHYRGRTTGMIKTNGANVSRDEVEEAARAWGGLEQVFVVGVPHPTSGEAVVLVAIGDESAFLASEFEASLRVSIAAYKLPRAVVFVPSDEIPRTSASDKVDYRALAQTVATKLARRPDDPEWADYLHSAGVINA